MPDENHLKILKQGIKLWNQWRLDHPSIAPDLDEANLAGADLQFSDLRGVQLGRANLHSANLEGANLGPLDFRQAGSLGITHITSLYGADLRNSILTRANLSNVILDEADLSYSNLTDANFERARFDRTNLSHTVIGGTVFGSNNLDNTKGLETVTHAAPSSIGIDTLYKSKGNIPDVFLRGAGIPEDFIAYSRSLAEQALDFYSCFISFAEADDPISRRIYIDLQGAGIRCWRWKEDAKWGLPLMRSIEEAIRIYDKLIVICSEHSLQSPPVIREIELALRKEDELAREGKNSELLFPISVDDFIFTGWSHHRKADVIAKNVGDFRNWKDYEYYHKAISRLIRSLTLSIATEPKKKERSR
jgi:hypothetical protein